MKKLSLITTLAVFVLVALLSVLPGSTAQAAEPATISLFVRNSTGGTVSMVLTDQLGFHFTFTYAPGMTTSTLKEGNYTYYANTPCGAESGSFNLNRSKKLDFFCSKEGREINLYNTYQQSCELMMKVDLYGTRGPGPTTDKAIPPSFRPHVFYETNSHYFAMILGLGIGHFECYDGVTPLWYTVQTNSDR